MDTFLKFIHMTISYFIYTRKIPLLSISDSMFSDKNRSHFFSFYIFFIYTVGITLAFYVGKKSLGTIKKNKQTFPQKRRGGRGKLLATRRLFILHSRLGRDNAATHTLSRNKHPSHIRIYFRFSRRLLAFRGLFTS